jgi:hypothetical protein
MRSVLAAALVVGLGGFAPADDKKVDPVGTWKCETDVNGTKRESTLTLKKDGDKITGTMTWQDKMESKIEGAKLTGGDLTFSAARELKDQKLTIKYTLKIDGDTLKGKAEVELGGETRTADVEGKREKAEAKKDK